MPDNKIKYGLKNVYYAVATIANDGSATYAAPKAIPGAVSLSMEPQGSNEPFYADNIVYYVSNGNTGYEGDLEVALIPDSFKKEVLGFLQDTNGVLVEDIAAPTVHFALLFQFEGDQKATKHVMYNCTATRPTAAGNTKEDTVSPETETITVTATSVYNNAIDKDIVKAEIGPNGQAAIYTTWVDTVYQASVLTT